MEAKLKIIFICTSNKDRSVALEKFFREKYPQNEYRSAGINKYFTTVKGTHYLTEEDVAWVDLMVFAETIHHAITHKRFLDMGLKKSIILNCGEYEQGNVGEDYLLKAEEKLKKYI